jgi:hypothetical protein
MKKRIKDLTKEELKRYLNSYDYVSGYKDNEKLVESIFMLKDGYLYGKPMLSDEFLNIKIDIPQPHILDKQEHDYLRAVIKPYKVKYIKKTGTEMFKQFIEIVVESSLYYCATESWSFPFFKPNSMYKGMEVNKKYTLEELELDKEWNND